MEEAYQIKLLNYGAYDAQVLRSRPSSRLTILQSTGAADEERRGWRSSP